VFTAYPHPQSFVTNTDAHFKYCVAGLLETHCFRKYERRAGRITDGDTGLS